MTEAGTSLVCSATGRPAYAEMRLGQGAAWVGSRHDGTLFVAVSERVQDGAYSDDEIERLLKSGDIVAYGDTQEGLFPAWDIGVVAATQLFVIGAGQVEDAIDARASLSDVMKPLTASLLGTARPQQGPDIVSLGKQWALQEYARGLRPLVDLDPKDIAAKVFADLVAVERRRAAPSDVPALRTLH